MAHHVGTIIARTAQLCWNQFNKLKMLDFIGIGRVLNEPHSNSIPLNSYNPNFFTLLDNHDEKELSPE